MTGQVSDATMRAASTRVANSLGPMHQTAARPALKFPGGAAVSSMAKSSAVSANSQPADTTTGTTTSADSNGTITASDFLTLLVTEMQNQDPTQPTDPNEYIQQLVGVNSLQQLIGINQELGTALTTTSTSSATLPSTSRVGAVQPTSNF